MCPIIYQSKHIVATSHILLSYLRFEIQLHDHEREGGGGAGELESWLTIRFSNTHTPYPAWSPARTHLALPASIPARREDIHSCNERRDSMI